MSPGPGLVATRRTALAGACGGALALAGCDAEAPSAAPSSATSAAGATTSPTAGAAAGDADQALVEQVVAELDTLIAFTSAAAAARPRNASRPEAFERLHRAHRAVLTDESPATAEAPPMRGSAQEIGRRVGRREAEAQRQLAEWAVAARSGPLARLLASMSAAIAQQLATTVRVAR